MKVPFKARCRLARPISVLKVKEEVEVLRMAPEEECESEMFVWVARAGERIAAPLAQLQPHVTGHEEALHAICLSMALPHHEHNRPESGGPDWLFGASASR